MLASVDWTTEAVSQLPLKLEGEDPFKMIKARHIYVRCPSVTSSVLLTKGSVFSVSWKVYFSLSPWTS